MTTIHRVRLVQAIILLLICFGPMVDLGCHAQDSFPRLIHGEARDWFSIADNLTLCSAISRGDSTELRRLLDSNIDVNQVEENGMNVLLWASMEGNLYAFEMLLEYGADIHTSLKTWIPKPPLDRRVSYHYLKDSSTLVSTIRNIYARMPFIPIGARYIRDVEFASDLGCTPLHQYIGTTVLFPGPYEADLRLFCKMGVDINARMGNGKTPIRMAANYFFFLDVDGYVDKCKALLKLGADPEIKSSDGTKLLDDVLRGKKEFPNKLLDDFQAALTGSPDDLKKYLETAFAINYPVPDTPLPSETTLRLLCTAIREFKQTEVEELAKPVRKIDTQFSFGMTALMYALLRGNREAFDFLLEKGASPDVALTAELQLVDRVSFVPHKSDSVLLAAGWNPFSLPGFFESALKYTQKPNQVDSHGRTILHQFLYYPRDGSDEKTLDLILASGVDLNRKTMAGDTACHRAAVRNPHLISKLVLLGADPMILNRRGETVLKVLLDMKPSKPEHARAIEWLQQHR